MGVPWWVWPQSVAWVLAHGYLWLRLVRDTTAPGGWSRRVGTAVLAVLAPLVPGALVGMHLLSPSGGRWLTWPGFTWYALLVFLLAALVPLELIRLVATLARRRRRRARRAAAPATAGGSAAPGDTAVDVARRRLLARGVALGAGALAVGCVGYGMPAALGAPRLERVTVRLRRLPTAASGLRIALVADMHLGPFLGEAAMRRVVDMVNGARPDLVVVAGDLVDGTVTDLRGAVAPLADLRSRHGTFFTTGNHEYLFDADAWVEHLRGLGVRPLRNTRVALPHLDLAGVNDHTGSQLGDPPDYARALDGRDGDRPVVLVAHQPLQVEQARKYDVDLQLSGHTHGGQFFPASALARLGNPLQAGHYRVGDTQLYVTRGAGFWGPVVRLGVPPEVTVLTLVPDAGPAGR